MTFRHNLYFRWPESGRSRCGEWQPLDGDAALERNVLRLRCWPMDADAVDNVNNGGHRMHFFKTCSNFVFRFLMFLIATKNVCYWVSSTVNK